MSILANQPTNPNPLTRSNFDFRVNKLPNTTYFIQRIVLPGVSVGESITPNPFVDLKRTGDKVTFDPLTVTFLVDEDLNNYRELFDWITSLGFDQNFPQFANLKNDPNVPKTQIGNIYTDASLTILTSKSNPNIRVDFVEMFPTSLSELEFSATETGSDVQVATVTFSYTNYTITTVT